MTANPIAQLRAIAQLREEGIPAALIKSRLGLTRHTLSHYRRLERLLVPAAAILIERAALSLRHARAIVRLPAAEQENFTRDIIQRRWSAHRAELEVRKRIEGQPAIPDSHYYDSLAETISEQIGHPVKIQPDRLNPHSGAITILYADFDCFDSVLARMRVKLPGDDD